MATHTITSRPGSGEPLVTVVVPARNAADTIHETLVSVRSQTYRNLEVIVVDDGSTDDTAGIVARHARMDPRMRLVSQANSGVAAARNRGVIEGRGEFIAPIDADDLWRPTKIARQMKVMLDRGPGVGLVYTWHAVIDRHGRVLATGFPSPAQGRVLETLLRRNFVGNGSSPLMRRQAILEAGGYDTRLRAKAAEGCEDLKLYLKIAERYEFAVVRDYLTGYRRLPGNMSSDHLQMLRSSDLVLAEFLQAYPARADAIRQGRAHIRRWLFQNAVNTKERGPAATLAWELLKEDRRFLTGFLARRAARAPRRWAGKARARLLGSDMRPGPRPFLPLAGGAGGRSANLRS